MRITNFWPFLLVLLSSGSCKQRNQGSDVESLANFAGGREVNQCKGSFSTSLPKGSVVAPVELSETVKQALTAVPTGVQRVFFETFKGRLIVSVDAAERCRGVKNSEVSRSSSQKNPQVISCWRPEGGVPVIRVNAKKADVLHAMVRAFGYFVSEEWLKGNDSYCQKAAVGKALLEDVRHSNGRFHLGAFASRLDSTVLAEDLSPEDRSEAIDDLPPPVHSAARDLFYDYAFAEAFDSYFCSTKTRTQMTAKNGVFRLTGEAFAGMAGMLEELSPEAVASTNGDDFTQNVSNGSSRCSSSGEGFGLFGRYRSGSIVQNIRNRRSNGWGYQEPVYYGNGQQQQQQYQGQVQSQGQVEWSNQYGASTVARMNFAQELRGYADGYYKKEDGTESTYVWITNAGRRTAYKVQYSSGKWIVLPGSTTAEPAVPTSQTTATATSTKTATSTSTSTSTAATSTATATATGTSTSTNTPAGTTTTISPLAVNNTKPTPTATATATATGTSTTSTATATKTATATSTSAATGTDTTTSTTSTTVDSLEQAKKDAAKLRELLGGLQDEPSAEALGETPN